MTAIAKPAKKVVPRVSASARKVGVAAAVDASSAQRKEPMGRDVLVPLDKLTLSDANVRKVHHEDGLLELAALIESQGLLQRLSIVALGDDRFGVVAGGRRLRAMQLLVAAARWPADQPIECKLYAQGQAVQVSLAENSGREAMHPADQMESFRRLIEDGLTVAQVAARFGVSPLTVERRLKLARLAPRFLDLYRADEIEADQLQALALIDDPASQEAVWDGLSPYDRSAWRIRNAVTEEACSADSRLARFVGLDAYEAEGGSVRRDLFSSPEELSGIYLDNPTMLQALAMDKLRGIELIVKEEGWSWVACSLESDMSAWRRYRREDQSEREPTSEEAETIERLAAEQRQHADAYERHQDEGDPEADDYERIEQQLCDALDQAEEDLMAARAALRHWAPGQLARAGALVRLDHRGEIVIERGLVRPEDRKATTSASSDITRADPEAAEPPEPAEQASTRPEFSEKLMRDLTAHRTAALQAALMQNPQLALVTLVHRMAETVFSLYGSGDDIVKVAVRVTGDGTLAGEASEYAESPAATLLGEAETMWGDRLPGNPAGLFRWLLAQPQDTLLELLAYCTARSVNAIAARTRSTANHSDALAEALGVDLADWWIPSAGRYLNHVSKAKALEAVKEATGVDPTQAAVGMKKPDLVSYCASKLEGTRWVPAPLRRLEAQRSSDDIGDQAL
ncbi:ParB/RepB/Spo0J family partition protein [Variovorax sp. dw_954]|uniref:ParB/RepB/Spo0J family partition protein n=1 Tax=Variovorax sp. dw_954 TaxID=2720078 RepID=UPI001BD2EDA0|nr:ParB/RepB/Spo0J family partition protein [Variovorax sp. dw_954]